MCYIRVVFFETQCRRRWCVFVAVVSNTADIYLSSQQSCHERCSQGYLATDHSPDSLSTSSRYSIITFKICVHSITVVFHSLYWTNMHWVAVIQSATRISIISLRSLIDAYRCCSVVYLLELRFCSQHQISWVIDWLIEWVSEYATFLHGLAQQ